MEKKTVLKNVLREAVEQELRTANETDAPKEITDPVHDKLMAKLEAAGVDAKKTEKALLDLCKELCGDDRNMAELEPDTVASLTGIPVSHIKAYLYVVTQGKNGTQPIEYRLNKVIFTKKD